MLLFSSADCFLNDLFQKILSGTFTGYQGAKWFGYRSVDPNCLRRLSAGDKSRYFSILKGFQATSTGTHYKLSLDRQDVLKSYQNMLTCDVCDKKFPFKSKLDEHVRSHSDVKSFKCDLCEKAFKHRKSLRIHFLSQHSSYFDPITKQSF